MSADKPVIVQFPLASTVVVPIDTLLLYKVMVVPAASVDVPETVVAPVMIGDRNTGAVDVSVTVIVATTEIHLPLWMA